MSIFSLLKNPETESLSKKLNKGKFRLILDINKYSKKYKADLNDYKLFKMYQKTDELNKTYITKGINDRYINKYNKGELIIPNKVKINTKKLPPQNEELNVINKKPCIFKFLVFKEEIISCVLELSNTKPVYAQVNIETGILDYPGTDLNGKTYDRSPSTKEELIWFRIPKWPRICRYVQNIATNINHKYIEISIYLDEEGPILVGINNPTYYLYQLHIDNIQEKGIKFLIEERENNK